MKLTINEDNVDALKVIIAANEANQSLDIEKGNGLVPCLADGDAKFFSVNTACLYVHEKASLLTKKVTKAIEDHLEWELGVLRPLISVYLITRKNGEEIKKVLQNRIDPFLDRNEGQLTICANCVSVSDIVIWCDLYPLWRENSELFGSLPKVKQWMVELGEKESFQKAIDVAITSKGKKVKWNFATWLKSAGASDAKPSSTASAATVSACDAPKESPVTEAELDEARKAWNESIKVKKQSAKGEKVLPKQGQRNVLITSALPYVNNVPHLGNIVGCVLSADVFARFCRLRCYNTLYVCGTDEYGTSTETKALAEGLTCQEICDKYNKLHAEIYQWFEIAFDHFGRTTTEKQTKIAQDIFWQLHKSGNLVEDAMDQLYCEKCDKFLADRFVEGNCPFCNFEDARGDQCDACGKLINAIELKNPRCKICSCKPQVKSSRYPFLKILSTIFTSATSSSSKLENSTRTFFGTRRCSSLKFQFELELELDSKHILNSSFTDFGFSGLFSDIF